MQSMQAVFEAYGIDYKRTMDRFMGNEEMYKRLMVMLESDKNIGALESTLKNEDLRNAFEAAHTLKGVAANMGLDPLYRVVCNIVEPLRLGEERSDYLKMYQEVRDEYDRMLEFGRALRQS